VHRVAVAAAAIAALLLACGGNAGPSAPSPASPAAAAAKPTPPATLRTGPPLAVPGEQMQYKLSLQGVELATYHLAIGEVTEVAGKQAIVVQGHAKVSGLAAFLATIDDRFTSWVDIATGHPVRFQVDEFASGSKTDVEHALIDFASRDGDMVPVTFHLNDIAARPEPQKVSHPTVWDFNAFLLALRAWEGAPGTSHSFEVFRSRYLWHVDVTIHGKDKLVTALGELPALRIDGRTHKLNRKGVRDPDSAERVFRIWISDDEGRVPLAIRATTDYGDLKMQIVDYQPGSGRRL
jgi:Protein of unknown function (DUF3108)